MRRLALVLALAVPAGGAAAQDFPGFVRQATGGGHAVTEVVQPHPVRRAGVVTTRFELRAGDCDAPCPADTERARMVEGGAGQPTRELFYTVFSFFIPRATAATPGLAVTLATFEQGDAALLSFRWTESGLVADGPAFGQADVLVPANLLAGRWHDVLVEHVWTGRPDGFLRVWVNGQRGRGFAGATMAGAGAVRFSYGLSRAPVSAATRFGARAPTQVVYFAHVRRGADRGAVDIDLSVR